MNSAAAGSRNPTLGEHFKPTWGNIIGALQFAFDRHRPGFRLPIDLASHAGGVCRAGWIEGEPTAKPHVLAHARGGITLAKVVAG